MREIRWKRAALPALLLGASLALVACDEGSSGSGGSTAGSASAAEANASAAAAAAAASASAAAAAKEEEHDKVDEAAAMEDVQRFHRHHHGGLTAFVSMAAETLGLDSAKKAQVEKIRTDLQAKMAPARDAEHDLMGILADGVAAGKIDTAKVDAQLAKAATAWAAVHNATGDALTQLHDALSPAERQALVDKVKAHWEVWQKVNTEEKPGSTGKGTHLEHLTTTLSLTPDQVTKITAALGTEPAPKPEADPKPVDAYVTAFATAFTADKFDPKALQAPATAAAGHVARNGGARMAHFYEAVTPILTPDQRTKLAAHIRERMNDHGVESSKPAAPASSTAPAATK